MFLNAFFAALLLVAAVSFGWLATRAWFAHHVVVRWAGSLSSGLMTLVLAFVGAVAVIGLYKAYMPRPVAMQEMTVAGTAEQVARGEHLAGVFCASCHSLTNELPLTGGVDIGKDIPLPVGSFVTANLTPGGPLKTWTDAQIFNAIRNGLDNEGRPLFVMSNARGRHMSDEDIQAVIAFLRSQPTVDHETQQPLDQPSFLGVLMFGAGMLPAGEPPTTTPIVAPAKAPTAEYGAYILRYQDCMLCHGEDLRGGDPNGLGPVGPSLAMVKGWTLEQFSTTLRTGVDPNGHELDNAKMPWRSVGRMDDDEIAAVYAYILEVHNR